MIKQALNVRKTDIHPADAVRAALSGGSNRLTIKEWWFKIQWWKGSVEGNNTTITVEPRDDRR